MQQNNITQTSDQSDDITRLAKGAGVSSFGKLIGRSLNFFGQAIFARSLGPEAFGVYSIGWTILRMISVIGPLGFDSGVIRFASKYRVDEPKKFRYIFFISSFIALFSGIVTGGIIYFSASFIANAFQKPGLEYVLHGFAFAIPLVTLLRIFSSTTTVSQRLQYATYSEEISQPGSAIIFFIFFYFLKGWQIESAVWSSVLSFVVALLLASFYLFRLFPTVFSFGNFTSFDSQALSRKELIKFSIPTAFAALFGSFISWVDRLLVGYFRSGSETGIYSTISLVSIIFTVILSGIKVIYSPMIANLYYKKEMTRAEELYRISTKWGLYIGIPIFLFFLFSSRDILGIVFGSEYVVGAIPLIILAFSQLLNIGTGPMDILLIMTGRQKTWMAISGIMLLINLFVNSFLIPRFGLIGAAIGTASTVSGIFIIGLIFVKRDLNIWPYDRRFLKCFISAFLTFAALLGATQISLNSSIWRVLLSIFITFVVFTSSLLLQGLDGEDKELLDKIKWKLKI